jgi:hypothetical protein
MGQPEAVFPDEREAFLNSRRGDPTRGWNWGGPRKGARAWKTATQKRHFPRSFLFVVALLIELSCDAALSRGASFSIQPTAATSPRRPGRHPHGIFTASFL